jgi:hypothetical protein
MHSRISRSKPDVLLLLALVAALGVFLSGRAHAEKYLFSENGISVPHFSQLMDGDLRLAPVGHGGGVLQMSFNSPSQENRALYVSQSDNAAGLDQGIRLSVKLPW